MIKMENWLIGYMQKNKLHKVCSRFSVMYKRKAPLLKGWICEPATKSFHSAKGLILLINNDRFYIYCKTINLPENQTAFDMKRLLMSLLTLVLITKYVDAQNAEDSVKSVIKQLFEGMRNSDGSAIRGAFADSAILQTISQ